MARLSLGVAAIIAGLSGCATQAHYVEQHDDSGIVAIPENTETSRTDALALIEKHVGPNYEITEERSVTAHRRNIRNQHARTETVPVPGRITPTPPIGDAQPSAGTHEVAEWRISYRKRSATWISENNPGGATANMSTTTPNGVQQTQGVSPPNQTPAVVPADSIVPSVAPISVAPAGACPGACPNGRCNAR